MRDRRGRLFLILPDWQGRRLNQVMATVLASCARYLAQVLEQYASGMRDDLPYRIARRDMHNADAALSVALSNMLREPGRYRRNLDAGFRFLALSNTLLGYLSALGAHRAALDGEHDPAIAQAGDYLQRALGEIATALRERKPLPVHDESQEIATAEALEQHAVQLPPKQRLVRDQLALTLRLLPKLRAAALAVTTAPTETPTRLAATKA